jgi:hypothetical protein
VSTSLQPNPLRPQQRRSALAEQKRDRAIEIGIFCTIAFHVLLFVVAPYFPVDKLTGDHSNLAAIAARKNKTFDFELANPPSTPPQPDPFKFVETNPDAPENEPDKTNAFSNRNQQSAQQEAPPEKDPENRPSVKGQDAIKNESAIVTGNLSKPQDGAAVTPSSTPSQEAEQQAQQAKAEQIPLSGFEKTEGQSPDGVATNVAKDSRSQTTNATELVEGAKDGKAADGGFVTTNQVSKPQPKPRPRLTQARQNVLQNRLAGTTNIGILGIDARWSEYGEYMQELIEIVQAQWYSILRNSAISPKSGTHVIVTFRLNSAGEVTIQSVEETAGKPGTYACQSAITERQPYRKWTDQMIAVLGTEQSITFSFYYW